MKLVVGLGNPGKRYHDTRHNIGFKVVDELAGRYNCRLKRSIRFRARIGKCSFAGGEGVQLLQPQAYMNNSGPVVAAVIREVKENG